MEKVAGADAEGGGDAGAAGEEDELNKNTGVGEGEGSEVSSLGPGIHRDKVGDQIEGKVKWKKQANAEEEAGQVGGGGRGGVQLVIALARCFVGRPVGALTAGATVSYKAAGRAVELSWRTTINASEGAHY